MRILLIFLLALTAKGDKQSDVKLTCKFRDLQARYTCFAEGLENSDETAHFSSIAGKHLVERSNSDVREFVVQNQRELTIIPEKISSQFPELLRFTVKNTPVTKLSAKVFENLKVLEFLKLMNNLIEELPSNVFTELENLKVLQINGNKLKTFQFKTFEKNKNLEILNLDGNQINFIHEKLFNKLLNLQEIYLQNNELVDLREQTFAQNKNLQVINFRNNKLKTIGPEIIKKLKNLKRFDFSANDCVKNHGEEVEKLQEHLENFCSPPDFKRFEDEIKELKTSEETLIKSLKECEIVKDEAEKESRENKETFESKIGELESDKTKLEGKLTSCNDEKDSCKSEAEKSASDLKSCSEKLESFEETSKNCTESEERHSKLLKSIENSVKNATEFLQSCIKDKEILTDALILRNITIELKDSMKIKSLEEKIKQLEKENNQLQRSKNELTLQLNEVTSELELIRNETKSQACSEKLEDCRNKMPICSSFFINCDFSSYVYGKNSSDDEYICMASHVSACAAEMKLQSVDGTHFGQRSNNDVNVLEIKDSFFTINNEIFSHLPNVRKLKLRNAGLESLQPNLKSSRLTSLEVEENKIKEIQADVFVDVKNLKTLFLEKNQIEKLHENSFRGLDNLLKLSLAENNIVELPLEIFEELTKLSELSIHSNKVQSLDGTLLKFNQQLEIVQFYNNPRLRFIGSDLLDYSKVEWRFTQFKETCVGNYETVEEIKKSFAKNCS